MPRPTKRNEVLTREQARVFSYLSPQDKARFIATLSDAEAAHLMYTWECWARDKQLEPPGNWSVWLIMAGRGFGKTRGGAEYVRKQVEEGKWRRIALVGRTAADVRDVMIDGESGILACSPPWFMPKHEASKRRLTWPNGAVATTFSAEEPNSLRGPQFDGAWADEPAAWEYEEAWDQLMFGLRLGKQPRVVATTTPRATKLIRELARSRTTHITIGTTYENRDNLAHTFFEQIISKYEGTQLGRQELLAEILEDVDGALWRREWIERSRVLSLPLVKRIVIGVDPPATSSKTSDDPGECGIVVAALGMDNHGYVIADCSRVGSPHEWASAVVTAYHLYQADKIVAEVNFGGEMVEEVIRSVGREQKTGYLPIKQVRASRGKQARAEPVSSLYEQGWVHHVGAFPVLEDQQCSWVPGEKSPDRLDAAVWALSDLLVGNTRIGGMIVDSHLVEEAYLDTHEEEEGQSLW